MQHRYETEQLHDAECLKDDRTNKVRAGKGSLPLESTFYSNGN